MRIYKSKMKKFFLLFVFSVVIALLSSVLYAGYHYMKAGNYKGKHSIDIEDIKVDRRIKNNDGNYIIPPGKSKIVINIADIYINKLTFEYQSEGFSHCSIRLHKKNIYGETDTQEIQDAFMNRMPRSVVNISKEVSKIEIEFNEVKDNLMIYNFGIDNSLKINPLFGIFVFCAVFIIGFLMIFKKENAQMPAFATFICVSLSGICMLVLLPVHCTGMDEQIHYLTSYELGVSSKGEMSSGVIDYLVGNSTEMNSQSYDLQESVEERIDIIKVFEEMSKSPGAIENDEDIHMYSVGYFFQAIALKIGNILQLPFYIVWLMGKFSNILLYAVMMSLSVHIVPIGKRLLSVVIMIPSLVYMSALYTYDITVIAFITLAICILVREIVNPENIFQYKYRVAMVACIVLGCLPKAVYAPLIIISLFFKRDKFYSRRDFLLFRGIVIFVFLSLMSTFVLPAILTPPAVGDTRGGDTSVARQLHYVLGQPFSYAIVFVRNVLYYLENFIFGNFCNYAYLGNGKVTTLYVSLITGVLLTDTYGDRKVLSKKYKIVIIGTILTIVVLIWTALYLSFTEVGSTLINGVQARYYWPFIYLFYLCLQTDKISTHFSVENYQMAVMLLSSIILFQQMGMEFLLMRCL